MGDLLNHIQKKYKWKERPARPRGSRLIVFDYVKAKGAWTKIFRWYMKENL